MEDYTLFLNYFNKSDKLLNKQLERILKQTVQPKLVLACFLGVRDSKLVKTYNDFVSANKLKNWKYVLSDHNFKYIGRYQLAINIPTDYVVMLDDDRFPEEECLEKMVATAKEHNAIVSQYGWKLHKNKAGEWEDMVGTFMSPKLLDNKEIKKALSAKNLNVLPADYLCGGMVFHKNHLTNLFEEPLATDSTGEDIIFCLKSKGKGVSVLIYLPDLSSKGKDYLAHNDNGISSTNNADEKIHKIRSLLIQKYI